jgi:cell division protein FtsI (penicillin-binding protein 3)
MGFAPAEDPRVVVAVVLDRPAKGIYGGTVAAPVFREVAGYALRHLQVPPSLGVGATGGAAAVPVPDGDVGPSNPAGAPATRAGDPRDRRPGGVP